MEAVFTFARATVVLAAAAVAAGCGGGSTSGSETFTVAASETCLENAGVAVDAKPDVTVDATIGVITGELGYNALTVNLERTETDARNTVAAWQFLADRYGADTDGLLYRLGTVVVAWSDVPTDRERSAVEGCF